MSPPIAWMGWVAGSVRIAEAALPRRFWASPAVSWPRRLGRGPSLSLLAPTFKPLWAQAEQRR